MFSEQKSDNIKRNTLLLREI